MPEYTYGRKHPQAARAANEWPYGTADKHAVAARKGWETRRRNWEAEHPGEPIGKSTLPKSGVRKNAAKKAPVTTAQVRRVSEAERNRVFRHRVEVEHENADVVSHSLGGVKPDVLAAAKARAGWYHSWVETVSKLGMTRGTWEQVPYKKTRKRKA
jgi:hypothetical protein